jgi:diacylglycerol kinase family enzyme
MQTIEPPTAHRRETGKKKKRQLIAIDWMLTMANQIDLPMPGSLAAEARSSAPSGEGLGPWAIRTVQLFSNPQAGRRARRRIAALQQSFTEHGVVIIPGENGSGQLEIDKRADHVCCAGGDGTMRHVVAAVCNSGRNVSVSVYPNGTVNLIAMESSYPRDPTKFVRRVLDGGQRAPHYIALVDDVPMASCASVGPDSYAVEGVSSAVKRVIGRGAYIVAVGKLMFQWPRPKITVSHAGLNLICEAVYIAKGRYFAGRWTLAPEASARAPKLEVITLRRAARLDFLRLAWFLLLGRSIRGLPGVEHFSCVEVQIASADAPPLQADGDIVGRLPLGISLRAKPVEFA